MTGERCTHVCLCIHIHIYVYVYIDVHIYVYTFPSTYISIVYTWIDSGGVCLTGCSLVDGVYIGILKLGANEVLLGLPGPPEYAKSWPFGLFLMVLGHYFTYFGGPGISNPNYVYR